MQPVPLKLVLSDLHLGTGRLLPSGARNPREPFLFDRPFCELLRHYSSKPYEATDLELVFNGDTFELLDAADYAPGEDPLQMTSAIAVAQLWRILRGHTELFAELRRFAGRPGKSVRFLQGNHDRALAFPEVQAFLRAQLGERIAFSLEHYAFGRVWIEHGDRYPQGSRADPERPFVSDADGRQLVNHDLGSILQLAFFSRQRDPRCAELQFAGPGELLFARLWRDSPLFLIRLLLALALFFAKLWRTPGKHGLPAWHFSLRQCRAVFSERLVEILEAEALRRLQEGDVDCVLFGHQHAYRYRALGLKAYVNTGSWTRRTNLSLRHLGAWNKRCYAEVTAWDAARPPRVVLKDWRGEARPDQTLFPIALDDEP